MTALVRRNKFCPPGLPLPYLKKPPRRNRDAYRREVLGLPGPVDRWLTANSACGTTHLLCTLLMNNEVEDFVVCTVRRVRIEVCPCIFQYPRFVVDFICEGYAE
jgi:hypothetical protein